MLGICVSVEDNKGPSYAFSWRGFCFFYKHYVWIEGKTRAYIMTTKDTLNFYHRAITDVYIDENYIKNEEGISQQTFLLLTFLYLICSYICINFSLVEKSDCKFSLIKNAVDITAMMSITWQKPRRCVWVRPHISGQVYCKITYKELILC